MHSLNLEMMINAWTPVAFLFVLVILYAVKRK